MPYVECNRCHDVVRVSGDLRGSMCGLAGCGGTYEEHRPRTPATEPARPCVCAETSARNCPEHAEPATKCCATCSVPATSGALYVIGGKLWCGPCLASRVRLGDGAESETVAKAIWECVQHLSNISISMSRLEATMAERAARAKGNGR